MKRLTPIALALLFSILLAAAAPAEERITLKKIPRGWKLSESVQQTEKSKVWEHSRRKPLRTFSVSFWPTKYDHYVKGPYKNWKTGAMVRDTKIIKGWEETELFGLEGYVASTAIVKKDSIDYYKQYYLNIGKKNECLTVTYRVFIPGATKVNPRKLDLRDFDKFVERLEIKK